MAHPRTRTLLIGLLLAAMPAAAGTLTESFDDYSRMEPFRTTADWNVFDGRVELPGCEDGARTEVLAFLPDPAGGTMEILLSGTDEALFLTINRRDSLGRLLWENPVLISLSDVGQPGAAIAGDRLVLAWPDDSVHAILATAVGLDGTTLWPSPVQVNQDLTAIDRDTPAVAGLPDGSAVIAWTDSRSGTQQVYAQKMSPEGAFQWASSDSKVQPGGGLNMERNPRLTTDALGRTFVVWEEQRSDRDLVLQRLAPNGIPAWATGIDVSTDLTHGQDFIDLRLVEGQGIFVLWDESDYPLERVELMGRDLDGAALWGSDRLIKELNGRVGGKGLVAADGGLLVGYSTNETGTWEARTHPVDWNGLDRTPGPATILPPEESQALAGAYLAETAGGGAVALIRYSADPIDQNWMVGLTSLGAPAWDNPRRVLLRRGAAKTLEASFLSPGGIWDGFSVLWRDGRNGYPVLMGRDYMDPTNPLREGPAVLEGTGSAAVKPQGVLLPDTSVLAFWNHWDGERISLWALRMDPQWRPIWPAPIRICDALAEVEKASIGHCLDQLGRLVVLWIDRRSGEDEVYYQFLDQNGNRVFPTDYRLDHAPVGANQQRPVVVPLPDGTVAAVWEMNDGAGTRIYYNRILSNGWHMNPTELAVDDDPGTTKRSPALGYADDRLFVFYATDGAPTDTLRMREIDPITAPSVDIGGPGEFFSRTRVVPWQGDLGVIWQVLNGDDTSIQAQRISGGTELWSQPARVNAATPLSKVESLDCTTTSGGDLVVCFSTEWYERDEVFLQALDGAGNRLEAEDRNMVWPKPSVVDYAEAVSTNLSSGGPVSWALMAPIDNSNGGVIRHYLSNDGGATWHVAEPDLPLVFPTAGSDLRWGADLWAPPEQRQSPSISKVALIWDETALAVDLLLNDSVFTAGETFRLEFRTANSGPPLPADQYVVLDVEGAYWFWPGWTQELDLRTGAIPSGPATETLLEFVWPPDTGSADGIRFWAALVAPGTADLLGPYDMVEFGFE